VKMNQSSLNQAIYETICLPKKASIVDLGCRNAGYLNGIFEAFPCKIVKAVGVNITDKNFNVIPYSQPNKLRVMNYVGKFDLKDNTF
jgi:hypothetical protein